MKKEGIVGLSPYPWVDLKDPSSPNNGIQISAPNFCKSHFDKGSACKSHYEKLSKIGVNNALVQCPYGFASQKAVIDGRNIAITSIIPWPRLGGKEERLRSESKENHRISTGNISQAINALEKISEERSLLIAEELKHYSSALHEIRKINRTIKHEAEKIVSFPGLNYDLKNRITSIEKSSELMTYQFDILDLIANEDLATLERKTKSEIYRIFDKCVRIFEQTALNKEVRLNIEGSSPVAMVCDKTFPIIATVLIENAIKYSIQRGEVSVFISIVNERKARVEVRNVTARKHYEIPDIFSKGVRGTDDNTGHGFGLHLAQLVARQHDTSVELVREAIDSSSEKFNFYFDLDIISKSK